MAEIFGPFKTIPAGAKVISGNMPLSGMPIPSITGGPAVAGPATGGNSSIGNTYVGSNSKSWMTFAVIGIAGIAALIVWKKL